ncbi:MAG: hypothetical protein ACUVRM_04305 [Bacillota bacterium]
MQGVYSPIPMSGDILRNKGTKFYRTIMEETVWVYIRPLGVRG